MLGLGTGLTAASLLTGLLSPAASDVSPQCPLAVGSPVPVTSSPLPLKAIGGKHVQRPGWEPAGAPMLGGLIYDWGLMLRPQDPSFSRIVEAIGASAQAKSAEGCWFQWELNWGQGGRAVSIAKLRIVSEPRERQGRARQRPDKLPSVRRGYRFIAADKAYAGAYPWIGPWRSEKRPERTLIVAFDEDRSQVLAQTPLRLGSISTLPSMHAEGAQITVMGSTKGLEPIAYLNFRWNPPPAKRP